MRGDDVHLRRRRFVRRACVCAGTAVAGCLDRTATPTSSERTSTATDGTAPGTDTAGGDSTSATPTCTPTEPTRSVLVEDLLVRNEDDVDHEVTITVLRDGATTFERSLSVAGNGGGWKVSRPVFEAAGTYRVRAEVDGGATGHEASKRITVDDTWRRHNGVLVSVVSSGRVELSVLHADPTPPRSTCGE